MPGRGALGRPVCARQSTGRSLTRSWAGVGGRGPGGVKAPGSLSPEPPADLGPAQPSPGSGRPSRPPPPPSPLRQPHAERPACSRRASGPPGGLSKATLPHRSPGHGAGGLVVKPESSWRGELRMGRRPGGLGACSPAHKMPPPPTHHVSLWLSGSVALTQYTHTHTHTHKRARGCACQRRRGWGGQRERERERERGREREREEARETDRDPETEGEVAGGGDTTPRPREALGTHRVPEPDTDQREALLKRRLSQGRGLGWAWGRRQGPEAGRGGGRGGCGVAGLGGRGEGGGRAWGHRGGGWGWGGQGGEVRRGPGRGGDGGGAQDLQPRCQDSASAWMPSPPGPSQARRSPPPETVR